MANWGRVAGQAFQRGAPLIGVAMDYAGGKAEGEDDIRAGAGAIGSGLGGWGGAVKGAAAGAALGSVVPVIGTAAGGIVGGLAGGIAGSFAGGYAADRLDETVRGKNTGVKRNNMSQAVRLDNGDVAEVDDNGNFIGWIVKGGAVLAGGNAFYNVAREMEGIPQSYAANKAIFQADPVLRATAEEAASYAAREIPGDVMRAAGQGLRNSGNTIGRVWNAIPGNNAAKALGVAVIAGDQLTGANLSKGVGRVLAGGADMIANAVGFNTDFDGKNQVSQQAIRNDNGMERTERNRNIFNADDERILQLQRENLGLAEAKENRDWQRGRDESWKVANRVDDIQRRNYLTNFTADQADALLKGYMNDIPRSVKDSLRTVFSTRFN